MEFDWERWPRSVPNCEAGEKQQLLRLHAYTTVRVNSKDFHNLGFTPFTVHHFTIKSNEPLWNIDFPFSLWNDPPMSMMWAYTKLNVFPGKEPWKSSYTRLLLTPLAGSLHPLIPSFSKGMVFHHTLPCYKLLPVWILTQSTVLSLKCETTFW